MLIRHLCGAILTLLLATSAPAALPQGHESTAAAPSSSSVRLTEFQLNSQSMSPLKSEALSEIPTVAAAEKSDPLKYSVWVLIGLGPIMWIWLAFFPRIRRK